MFRSFSKKKKKIFQFQIKYHTEEKLYLIKFLYIKFKKICKNIIFTNLTLIFYVSLFQQNNLDNVTNSFLTINSVTQRYYKNTTRESEVKKKYSISIYDTVQFHIILYHWNYTSMRYTLSYTNKFKRRNEKIEIVVMIMHFRATRDGNWACKVPWLSWVTNTAKRKLQTSRRLAPLCLSARFLANF